MPLPKLNFVPESTGYAAQAGEAVWRSGIPGGHSRRRLDQLGAPITVDVSWVTNVDSFAYLGAFFRSIAHGSQPFLLDLILDQPIPVEHTVQFLPGSFQLQGISGYAHQCGARLEVRRPDRDTAADLALVEARQPSVDGQPVMALTPSAAAYSVDRGGTVLRSQVGLGPSRFRLDKFNSPSRVSAQWVVGTQADFLYLMAFYYSAIAEGALPFWVDAVMDHPDARRLRATLIPGSFALAGLGGKRWTFRADLDVVPVTSPDYDALVFELYDLYGEEWTNVLLSLDHLVNVLMPRWD